MSNKAGKISQIMGAVVDVSFEDNHASWDKKEIAFRAPQYLVFK